MFGWLKSIFSKKPEKDFNEDHFERVPPKRPYAAHIEFEEPTMGMTIEQQDSMASMPMVTDENGNLVPLSNEEAQAMMYRPGNYQGIQIPPVNNGNMRQQPQRQQRPQVPMQPAMPYPQQNYPQQNYPQQNYPQQPMIQQPVMQQPVQQVQAPVARKPYPPFEQYSTDNEYHIEIDLPGIDENSISIEYDDPTVVVSGYRETAVERTKKNGKRRKVSDVSFQEHYSSVPQYLIGKFSFDFGLKKMVDESAITADYTNGILHITLPHRSKGDKIKIGIKKQNHTDL